MRRPGYGKHARSRDQASILQASLPAFAVRVEAPDANWKTAAEEREEAVGRIHTVGFLLGGLPKPVYETVLYPESLHELGRFGLNCSARPSALLVAPPEVRTA